MQPKLEGPWLELPTERSDITLRQLHTDADAQAEFDAIEENRPYLTALGNTVGKDLVSVAATKHDWIKEAGTVFLGIWLNRNRFLGLVSVHPRKHQAVELGYWLRYSAQGQGYATLAVRAVTAHWKPISKRIFAEVHLENPESVRVLERAGWVQTGSDRRTWGPARVFEPAG